MREHDPVTGRLRYSDEEFVGLEADELELAGALLLGCTFIDCELNEVSLRAAQLSECRFERCEMTTLDLADAVFQTVEFETCRLTGNDFSVLNQGTLGVLLRFNDCDLGFCSFRKMDLTSCTFEACLCHESEFTRCELGGVSFARSDLARCVFNACDLTGADLRGARNYLFSPVSNRVRGMKVELPEAQGLLTALGVELH